MLDPGGADDSGLAASERVAAYLREAILDGTIAPGERIRQEEVAERLGASRLPVREALRMLALEGLTEFVVNKGARVPALDTYQLTVVYRMRERLEPLALMESMPHLSGAQIDRLEQIHHEIEQHEDVNEFLRLDRAFHLLTYSACPFDDLLKSVTRLWNATQHYRRTFMTMAGPHRRWVVNAEHALILDAIRRGDAVDAERYLTGHIRRTRTELSHVLGEHGRRLDAARLGVVAEADQNSDRMLPPSTPQTEPVVKEAAGLAKKTMARATSSGRPSLPRGS